MTDDQNPMDRVERAATYYSECRDALRERVDALQQEIDEVRRRHLSGIRDAVRVTAEARDDLQAEIEAHPELWSGRRRTVVIRGVRVGRMKGTGRLVWDDPQRVVDLIRHHFPDQAETLIKVKAEPVRKALQQLSVADLQRIGVTVEGTDDQVVIKPTDSEVDKLVDALLRDAERIEGQEAQQA